jgi:hypothetical protein
MAPGSLPSGPKGNLIEGIRNPKRAQMSQPNGALRRACFEGVIPDRALMDEGEKGAQVIFRV